MGRVGLGTLISGLGHLEPLGLCCMEMGWRHTEKKDICLVFDEKQEGGNRKVTMVFKPEINHLAHLRVAPLWAVVPAKPAP